MKKTTEAMWCDFERRQVAQERIRLFRLGRIKPARMCQPTRLEKNENGEWKIRVG